ncbi:BMP and activin membrane-bound inhibitor homolog isoform X2 [Macrobrachium nipponense]|uniref:BMP and activin membrane-bound inhibitor homolog isoform X2 n=1 Tax=Macrobrachium nipponense TaxID=159736 RepID=UPI0030C81382
MEHNAPHQSPDSLPWRRDFIRTSKERLKSGDSAGGVQDRHQHHHQQQPVSQAKPGDITTAFRYSSSSYQWFFLLVTLILLTRPFLPAADKDGEITCECTTLACRKSGELTCTTRNSCYSQLLKLRDGFSPITRGCISENGSGLLCVNPIPFSIRLVCCKESMCNRDVTPASTTAQYIPDEDNDETEPLERLEESAMEELRQKYDISFSENSGCYFETIYLAVIVVGILIMIIITATGFCLLRNYRTSYAPAPQDPSGQRKMRGFRKMLPEIVTAHSRLENHKHIFV